MTAVAIRTENSMAASAGGISFAALGVVVDRTGVLNGIPVPLAKEWVSAIRQNGPSVYAPSDVAMVLNALSERVAVLRGVDPAMIRSFVEVRRDHHKGGAIRYMPRGIDTVSKWLLTTLQQQHQQLGDLDAAAMGVCRATNVPSTCGSLILAWYSFTATSSNTTAQTPESETSADADAGEQHIQSRLLWVLMRAVGAVLSPASDEDVSQELAFQLFSDSSATPTK